MITDFYRKVAHRHGPRQKGPTLFLALTLLLMVVSCRYSGFNREDTPVMMPQPKGTDTHYIPTNGALPFLHSLKDIVLGNPEYGAVADMLNSYGALPYLDQLKDITLLLPVARTFDDGTCAQIEDIYTQGGTQGIILLLKEHSAMGRYDSARLLSRTANKEFEVGTAANAPIIFSYREDAFYVARAKASEAMIIMPDQRGTNGVLHGITQWLIPTP